MTSPTS